jgi:vacuolar-type H+-ATPase subunit H
MHPNPLIDPTGGALVSRWEPVFHLTGVAGMIGPITGKTAVPTPYGEAEKEEVTLSMGKKKTLRDHAGDLADTLAPHVESARDKAGPVLADARDKAAPVLADARDKAAPLFAEAKDKAGPLVAEARDRISSDVIPAVKDALAAVDDATEDVRAEAKKRGKAVAAAAKGEVDAPGSKHRVRKVLIALGLGGVAFAIAKRLGGQKSSANWQSSYTPPPAPVPPPAGGPVAGSDDTAASDPAEAAADSAEGPHDVTTPDDPAAEVSVDEPGGAAKKATKKP